MHTEGKTEEARSDLARLAIIRKQREEAAKKREEERLGNYVLHSNTGKTLSIHLKTKDHCSVLIQSA